MNLRFGLSVMALVAFVALSTSCGEEQRTLDGAGVSVTGITSPFPTDAPMAFTVTGTNFMSAAGDAVTVRFTAAAGTPFAGGASATADVPGAITSNTTVTGMSPGALLGDDVHATVTVILPTTVEAVSDGPIATFLPSVPKAPQIDAHDPRTRSHSMRMTGHATGAATIEIAGPWGLETAPVADGGFDVDVTLRPNVLNRLFFTAITSTGKRSPPAATDVLQDEQPPKLFIDYPADGAQLTLEKTIVTGRVGDLLSGSVGIAVSVNGIPAEVDVGAGTNGTFIARDVPLGLGAPVRIAASAEDWAGNETSKTIRVQRVSVPADAPQIAAVSGDMQTGTVQALLNAPIVVRMTQGGQPFANKAVTFEVVRSDGLLSVGPAPGVRMLQVKTDAQGLASANWRLGSDSGRGNNQVGVTSKDFVGTVLFCASANPRPASQINIGAGNNQFGETGSVLPEPLRVFVHDGQNGVPGVLVAFSVVEGDGGIVGAAEDSPTERTALTDATGHAEAALRLGPTAGLYRVEATFDGNAHGPATFTATAVARVKDHATEFEGVVLDNTSSPLRRATVWLLIGGESPQTTSDESGRFFLTNIPGSGSARLRVEGGSVDAVNGVPVQPWSFPRLQYDVVITPGARNSLGTPVLLPRLELGNRVVFDNSHDVVLTCQGIEGLQYTVHRDSMRRADGSRPAPGDPEILSVNQVHADSIPMPMPDGVYPLFAGTLQPAGALFDPPISIQFPNMQGLPPGAATQFLSFNHDTNRFEVVASMHVTEDGTYIVSNPGEGIDHAGWHGPQFPPAVTAAVRNCVKVGGNVVRGYLNLELEIAKALPILQDVVTGLQSAWSALHSCGAASGVGGFCNWVGCLRDVTQAVASTLAVVTVTLTSELSLLRSLAAYITDKIDDAAASALKGCEYSDATKGLIRQLKAVNRLVQAFLGALDAKKAIDFLLVSALLHLNVILDLDADCTAALAGKPRRLEATAAALTQADVDAANVAYQAALSDLDGAREAGARMQGHVDATQSDRVLLGALADHVTADVTSAKRPELAGTEVHIGTQTATIDADGGYEVLNVSAPDLFGATGPGSPADGVADDYVRLLGEGVVNGASRYVIGTPLLLTSGANVAEDDLATTTLPPPLPRSLSFAPHGLTLGTGGTLQMELLGTLSDGSTADLTPRTAYTTYRTSAPAVARVSPDGVATALAAGSALITAVNGGVAATTRVVVADTILASTVEGFVQLQDGTPAAGAGVSDAFGDTGTTDAKGFFSFPVTVPAGSTASIFASAVVAGQALGSVVQGVAMIPDGITDVGIVRLGPVVTWVGPTNGSWGDAANWSTGHVPGATDDVVISRPDGDFVITIGSGPFVTDYSVHSLQSTEKIVLGGNVFSTFSVATVIQVANELSLAGGTLRGGTVLPGGPGSSVRITGLGSVLLDGVRLDANVTVAAGSVAHVKNGLTLNATISLEAIFDGSNTRLDFEGTESLLGTGDILFATPRNGNGLDAAFGHLTIGPGIRIHGGAGSVYGDIVHRGVIRAEMSGAAIDVESSFSGVVRNEGTIEAVNGARVRLIDSWLNVGTVSASSGGHITLSGRLTGAQIASLSGALELDQAKVTGVVRAPPGSSLTLIGSSTFYGVALQSDLTIPPNMSLSVVSGLTLNATLKEQAQGNQSSILFFEGSQTLSGTGTILFDTYSEKNFLNSDTGTLTIASGVTLRGSSATILGDVVNQGVIQAEGAGGTIFLEGTTSAGVVRAVSGGHIAWNRNWSNTGTVQASTGGRVTLNGFYAGSALLGMRGAIELGGTVSGELRIPAEVDLTLLSCVLSAVTLQSDLTIPSNRGISVRNGLTLNATFREQAQGTASANLNFDGEQTLTGTGTILFDTASAANQVNSSSGRLTIAPGITIRGTDGRLSGLFTNQGLIRSEVSGHSIQLQGDWTNDGTVEAVNGGRIAAAPVLVVPPGGGHEGPGPDPTLIAPQVVVDVVAIPFPNAGTIRVGVGSRFEVTGDFAPAASSTLEVQLNGSSAGSFGVVAVSGVATLDGTLKVVPQSGFSPSFGDRLRVLTFGSKSSDFAAKTGLEISTGVGLDLQYDATGLDLVVVAR